MAFSMAGGGPSAQINVTPLIDVLLTLIIMFMLVVSMDKEYQEKAQIPQPDQKPTAGEQQSRTIVIQVVWTTKDAPPTVKINKDSSVKKLQPQLSQAIAFDQAHPASPAP